MKIGTDGVLLGAWARVGGRMLDIGTGSGLIALMLAQRHPHSLVEGVELDADAAAQARQNVEASPFASRVRVFESSFQAFGPSGGYDAIVSNPPFFLHSHPTPDGSRTTARHAETVFFKDFFAFVRRWLLYSGETSIIVPWENADPIAAEAYLAGLFLTRRIAVRTKRDKPLERCLLAFGKRRLAPPELGEVCLLDDDGSRGTWYRAITGAFYR